MPVMQAGLASEQLRMRPVASRARKNLITIFTRVTKVNLKNS
jgi:hypothetical protein